MEVLQWTVGVLVTINVAVTSFIAARLWAHVEKCGHVSADIARIDADVERMKTDIGTHDTGMRGEIHATSNMCQQHELRMTLLERSK